MLAEGEATTEELIRAAGDGFYVMDVSGLHSGVNPASGTFSVGASGRLIEGGELGAPAREVTIASDLVSMLMAVRAVGSESRWLPFGGSVKTPSDPDRRHDRRRGRSEPIFCMDRARRLPRPCPLLVSRPLPRQRGRP